MKPICCSTPRCTALATTGYDRTVRIRDPATGTRTNTLTGHTDRVEAVAVSPDGTWLATAGTDGTALISSTGSWEPVAMTRTDNPLLCCQ
ncbi:hypothetical protein [Streptomyces sp. WELS2]|uniref:WD40 repeat domain-containing protein n=1 Tax=Streptomyces sp. WELS2 TaxID=2749435 RepID=UPI0028682560|nr:hypothetical protein [Streptomyces sp. WELS2]